MPSHHILSLSPLFSYDYSTLYNELTDITHIQQEESHVVFE